MPSPQTFELVVLFLILPIGLPALVGVLWWLNPE